MKHLPSHCCQLCSWAALTPPSTNLLLRQAKLLPFALVQAWDTAVAKLLSLWECKASNKKVLTISGKYFSKLYRMYMRTALTNPCWCNRSTVWNSMPSGLEPNPASCISSRWHRTRCMMVIHWICLESRNSVIEFAQIMPKEDSSKV